MPNKPKNSAKPDADKRAKTTKEIEELHQRLSEAREQRDLLIRTLHGFTINAAATRALIETKAKPDLDTVLAWLIEEIGKLTVTRLILGMSTLTALKVPDTSLNERDKLEMVPSGWRVSKYRRLNHGWKSRLRDLATPVRNFL